MRDNRRKKENNAFKKFFTIYLKLLIALMIIIIIYVINSLLTYKSLQVDNYLDSLMEKIADAGEKNNISKYINVSDIKLSKYESKDDKPDKAIASVLKSDNLKYKLNKESTDLNNPVYDVYVEDKPFLSVSLNGEKKVVRLAILTMQDWKLDKVQLTDSKNLYECVIKVPNKYSVYVNDIKVKEEDKDVGEVNEELNELSNYTDLPYIAQYTIKNLLKEPTVVIKDENGKEIEYNKEDNVFSIDYKAEEIQDEKTALAKLKGKIDILKIAEDWSLYLTNDLRGKTNGFETIKKYLIKDSYMYKYAYKWATSVDITFISNHKLANPCFTNTKVNNFKIYNENAFSCDVYLEKNLILNKKSNSKHVDIMNDRMFFVYYENEWKLVNMQAITNNK